MKRGLSVVQKFTFNYPNGDFAVYKITKRGVKVGQRQKSVKRRKVSSLNTSKTWLQEMMTLGRHERKDIILQAAQRLLGDFNMTELREQLTAMGYIPHSRLHKDINGMSKDGDKIIHCSIGIYAYNAHNAQ